MRVFIFILALIRSKYYCTVEGFNVYLNSVARSNLKNVEVNRITMSKFEGIFDLQRKYLDILHLAPLCITPTSKTTVTNDPTAGMSPDEIAEYMNNFGGQMCGYPDFIRTAIWLGLNLSLIIFGLMTLSYGNNILVLKESILFIHVVSNFRWIKICTREKS